MENSFFQQPDSPIVATLANWAPKCNTELETRIRLDFEILLSKDLIALAPPTIQNAALTIGKLDNAMPSAPISTEFDQFLEVFATPDHTTPMFTIPYAKLVNLSIFRPTPKEGPSNDLFLTFSTTVDAEGPFGTQLVTWALPNLRRTIFFRSHDLQGSLPLTEAAPEEKAPAKSKGKGVSLVN